MSLYHSNASHRRACWIKDSAFALLSEMSKSLLVPREKQKSLARINRLQQCQDEKSTKEGLMHEGQCNAVGEHCSINGVNRGVATPGPPLPPFT